MEDFDIFDEWGNWVGTARPTGGLSGCLAGIAFVIAMTVVFAVFAIFKLTYLWTIKGFGFLRRGELGLAIRYLSPLWVTLLAITAFVVFALVSSHVQSLRNAQFLERVRYLTINPEQTLLIELINTSSKGPDCVGSCVFVYNEFKVTNVSEIEIILENTVAGNACVIEDRRLEIGQFTKIYCEILPPPGVCLAVETPGSQRLATWCNNNLKNEFFIYRKINLPD